MRPVRATQLWLVGILVGIIATAFVAKLAHEAWPELRSVSAAAFAAPGVALVLVLVLIARKKIVERAKGAAKGHL